MQYNSNKIGVGGLADAISEVLGKYVDEVGDLVDDSTEKATKKCLADIRANSRAVFDGSGKYAKGWKKEQTQKGRGSSRFTIYNVYPGLPHLLENGHANVNGGFVSGRTHIADAEQEAIEYYQNLLKEGISKQ